MICCDVLETSKLSEHTLYVRRDLVELELDSDDCTGYRLTEYSTGRDLVESINY